MGDWRDRVDKCYAEIVCKYRAFDDVINEGAPPLVNCRIVSRQEKQPGDRGDEWLVQAVKVLDYMGIETGDSEFDATTGVIEVNLEQLSQKVPFIRDNDYNVFFPIPFKSEVHPSHVVNPDVDFNIAVGDYGAHAECVVCGHYDQDGEGGTYIDGEFHCDACADGEEGETIEALRHDRHILEGAEPGTMTQAEGEELIADLMPRIEKLKADYDEMCGGLGAAFDNRGRSREALQAAHDALDAQNSASNLMTGFLGSIAFEKNFETFRPINRSSEQAKEAVRKDVKSRLVKAENQVKKANAALKAAGVVNEGRTPRAVSESASAPWSDVFGRDEMLAAVFIDDRMMTRNARNDYTRLYMEARDVGDALEAVGVIQAVLTEAGYGRNELPAVTANHGNGACHIEMKPDSVINEFSQLKDRGQSLFAIPSDPSRAGEPRHLQWPAAGGVSEGRKGTAPFRRGGSRGSRQAQGKSVPSLAELRARELKESVEEVKRRRGMNAIRNRAELAERGVFRDELQEGSDRSAPDSDVSFDTGVDSRGHEVERMNINFKGSVGRKARKAIKDLKEARELTAQAKQAESAAKDVLHGFVDDAMGSPAEAMMTRVVTAGNAVVTLTKTIEYKETRRTEVDFEGFYQGVSELVGEALVPEIRRLLESYTEVTVKQRENEPGHFRKPHLKEGLADGLKALVSNIRKYARKLIDWLTGTYDRRWEELLAATGAGALVQGGVSEGRGAPVREAKETAAARKNRNLEAKMAQLRIEAERHNAANPNAILTVHRRPNGDCCVSFSGDGVADSYAVTVNYGKGIATLEKSLACFIKRGGGIYDCRRCCPRLRREVMDHPWMLTDRPSRGDGAVLNEGRAETADNAGPIIVSGGSESEFLMNFYNAIVRNVARDDDVMEFEVTDGESYEIGTVIPAMNGKYETSVSWDSVYRLGTSTHDRESLNNDIEAGSVEYIEDKGMCSTDDGKPVDDHYDGIWDYYFGTCLGADKGGAGAGARDAWKDQDVDFWIEWGDPDLAVKQDGKGGYSVDARPLVERIKKRFVESGGFMWSLQ